MCFIASLLITAVASEETIVIPCFFRLFYRKSVSWPTLLCLCMAPAPYAEGSSSGYQSCLNTRWNNPSKPSPRWEHSPPGMVFMVSIYPQDFPRLVTQPAQPTNFLFGTLSTALEVATDNNTTVLNYMCLHRKTFVFFVDKSAEVPMAVLCDIYRRPPFLSPLASWVHL